MRYDFFLAESGENVKRHESRVVSHFSPLNIYSVCKFVFLEHDSTLESAQIVPVSCSRWFLLNL